MATMPTSSCSRTTSLRVANFVHAASRLVIAVGLTALCEIACDAQSRHATEAQMQAHFKQNAFRPGPTPPTPLYVEGDGRACMGYVHLTQAAFVWKWHWATCRADGWDVVDRDNTSWTIKLKETPAEKKACLGVQYVKLSPTDPDINKSIWNVSGMFSSRPGLDDPIVCGTMM